jgi:hypothetical protein
MAEDPLGQDHSGDHRLHLEEEKGGQRDREGVKEHVSY